MLYLRVNFGQEDLLDCSLQMMTQATADCYSTTDHCYAANTPSDWDWSIIEGQIYSFQLRACSYG